MNYSTRFLAVALLGSAAFFGTRARAAETPSTAQAAAAEPSSDAEAAYTKAIDKRAQDILAELKLTDAAKASRIHDTLVAQYRALRDWHDANDPKLKALRKQPGATQPSSEVRGQIDEIGASLKAQRERFLAKLSEDLTPEQVETVKDKMTYNKVQFTYKGYLQVHDNLTDEEKAKVLDFLKQAREEAIDGGSAEEKSDIFNRYKGRINNYLAAQGHTSGKKAKTEGATTKPATNPAAASPAAAPAELKWASVATGTELNGQVLTPTGTTADAAAPLATVVYLRNLSIPRLGQESDESILADLRQAGHLVLTLDYARHAKAVSPDVNADVLKLRDDIVNHKLLGDRKIDPAHVFVLAEGFRLKRDVEFYRDGKRVLGMDIQYPSRPKAPVPVLLEITCDNQSRMGSGSILFCRDTLLDGGMLAGFAGAMADHPVAPPYKGIDYMPDAMYKLKAAVRTLRAIGPELGLSDKIGAVGFSRGSNMAALLATTGGVAELEGDGAHKEQSSRVQAALVHGGRFDYARLGAKDPMLARFEKAYGPPDSAGDVWARVGAARYLSKDAAPMFLNTSDAESPEYREQLAMFADRLKDAGVEHVYQLDTDGRGHRVSTDPKTLTAVYAFFAKHLGS